MLGQAIHTLGEREFLADVALWVTTTVGFLHLLLFFTREVIDVWRKFKRL
jgi:hypothetical protein